MFHYAGFFRQLVKIQIPIQIRTILLQICFQLLNIRLQLFCIVSYLLILWFYLIHLTFKDQFFQQLLLICNFMLIWEKYPVIHNQRTDYEVLKKRQKRKHIILKNTCSNKCCQHKLIGNKNRNQNLIGLKR